jgi:tRNA(fMet)-specific endonuclease VapC
MSRYLLDTSALIDLSKRREPARTRLRALLEAGDILGVCAINVAEFFSGIRPEERQKWEEFFQTLPYWDISVETAVRAGHDRYEFARKERPLPAADALIAAVARANDTVIITDNATNYPMSGVRTLSLRS